MACPHVAGAATLLYQVNPKFTPQNIRELLLKTLRFVDANGNPIQQPVWNASYGFGRIDAYAAIKMAIGTARRLFGAGFNMIQLASVSINATQLNKLEESSADMTDITAPYATESAQWLIVNK